MDKILRRVRMAERNVARRAQRQALRLHIEEKTERIRAATEVGRQARVILKEAVKARREDLELGPLAPRREGTTHIEGNFWGSISIQQAMLNNKITPQQRAARSAWAGGPNYLCLAVGDRVVVLEGADKGKIAPIEQLDKDQMTVILGNGVGMANIHIPRFLRQEGQDAVQVFQTSIPISSVRLVHPIPDPVTGEVRDRIIRELKPVGIVHDRATRRLYYSRVVPGLNLRIPWPKQKPVEEPDHPVDTLRLDVEERTFVPTLLRPPMPESVIDELRNKYSKFRTRHTDEYIAEVERREAEKRIKKHGDPAAVEGMLLPIQEYHRKVREEKKKRGQPELTEEMLAKIGEVIARNKYGGKLPGLEEAETQQSGGGGGSGGDATTAEVDKVQKAVEELALGGDEAAKPPGGDQPTTGTS